MLGVGEWQAQALWIILSSSQVAPLLPAQAPELLLIITEWLLPSNPWTSIQAMPNGKPTKLNFAIDVL